MDGEEDKKGGVDTAPNAESSPPTQGGVDTAPNAESSPPTQGGVDTAPNAESSPPTQAEAAADSVPAEPAPAAAEGGQVQTQPQGDVTAAAEEPVTLEQATQETAAPNNDATESQPPAQGESGAEVSADNPDQNAQDKPPKADTNQTGELKVSAETSNVEKPPAADAPAEAPKSGAANDEGVDTAGASTQPQDANQPTSETPQQTDAQTAQQPVNGEDAPESKEPGEASQAAPANAESEVKEADGEAKASPTQDEEKPAGEQGGSPSTANADTQADMPEVGNGDEAAETRGQQEAEAEGEQAAGATDKPADPDREEGELSALPSEVVTTDTNATATVKFVLVSTGQVATMRWALNQTLTELKEHFSRELKIPAHVIMLMFQGKDVLNDSTLADLGVGPNGTVQLEMQSADPVNTPIRGFRPRLEYIMPDVITVRVYTEGDSHSYNDVVVEIERVQQRKPYMGGYRHKVTGAEYHHAAAQTMGPQRAPSSTPKFCRDSQTVQMRHHRQQTSQDTSTQMTKIGLYVSNMEDKVLSVGKYTTADQHHRMVLRNVIVLQKYWRRWLAQRVVAKLRTDRNDRLAWERSEQVKKRKEKDNRIKQEFQRRMNPKTKEDFDLLFSALEKWRLEELDKINSSLSGAERKAALCQLLEQETQLIASIGLHKQNADEQNKKISIQNFLEKAASPKCWKGPDGQYTQMDTAFTVRARELKDIYNSITMKYLTQDERLDVLLTLKHTVKEHDCKLTQEIIGLIDREANLLMRGTKDANLDGLRQRIATLFLQYIKTPTFNPEVSRLLKVPQDPSSLRQDIYYCPGCSRYLSSTEFQLATNSKSVGRCRKCRQMDNDARVRQDFRHYRHMLRSLRQTEESFGDDSKVAFLLQESDLRYLMEKVWGCQSVVSAWDDLHDIILVRWHKFEEWSPWNCVCLTKEEATAHEKLESLQEGYGEELIQKVKRKHTLARSYFSRLPGMAEHMRVKTEEAQAAQLTGIKATPIPTVKAAM